MGRHTKVIAAILTAVFLFSAFGAISVYAEDVEPNPDPGYTEPAYNPEPEPTYPDMPVEPEPVVTEPTYNPDPYNPEPYDDGGNTGGNTGDNTGGGTGNNGSGWVDSDGNVFSSPQDVYVGGGQSYQPPQSTAPSAALYDTKNKKVDDKTLPMTGEISLPSSKTPAIPQARTTAAATSPSFSRTLQKRTTVTGSSLRAQRVSHSASQASFT